ncbi:MAG: hypothetical protein JW864_09810 [Spirochaetes bacterium]|nr:hypothetical protein [Spirochaetota bacterium]
MPFNHTIIVHQNTAVVEADGIIDLSSIIQVMRDVAFNVEFESHFSIIVDLRKMKYTPTSPEIFTIRDSINSMKQQFQGNITLVMAKETLFLAKLICLLAKPYQIKMKAVTYSDELESLMNKQFKEDSHE